MINLSIRLGPTSYYYDDYWQVEGTPDIHDNILVNEIRAVITGIYREKDTDICQVWAVEETLFEKEHMLNPDLSIGAFDDI